MEWVEIRCPEHPVRLLLKLERPRLVVEDGMNIIEIACKDCRSMMRKRRRHVVLVVHRFNIAGEFIETVVT